MDIGNVRVANIDTEVRQSYLDYAMSVIVQRALPDARDGLKPVHRRVLFAMWEMGMRSSSRFRKSAGTVGEVMKNYHPHGDSAIYDTLVRMAQPFNLRYPLIDGQGNFGSVDGDSAAAMRYTESRLAQIADELLLDIDKNTVDFIPNYDATMTQPTVLPGRLPNLLLNGAAGIAVGMATNIPPHNLNELCDAIAYLIDNPEATVDELMQFVPGPDFPTGGTILGTEGIRAAYATGRGRVVIRAKAFVEESARGNRFQIIVTELPYQVNKALLLERIAELVKEGKLDGISDLRDESDRTGMRMVIELKRDAQPLKVLNNLFKHTSLQQSFGVNMLALVERGTQPRILSLRRALQEYIGHRQEVTVRRAEYELERARRRAHILEGLLKALDSIDQIIATIRGSSTTEDARNNLIGTFGFTEIQANAILDMRLARLAGLERQKIEDEYKEIMATIAELEALLADPQKVLASIKADLSTLKEKYGDERRTVIQDVSSDLSVEDLIPEIDVLVTMTNRGYVKRIPADVYRTQRRGGKGVTGLTMREEDGVQHIFFANTMESLLVFTNRGKVYQVKVHELPDAGRTAKGLPIVNIISMLPDETVTTFLNVRDFSDAKYLFFTTRMGTVKRVSLDQFKSVRSNGMIAINLDQGDELIWVRMSSGNDDVVLTTRKGQAIRFTEEDVRPMGRPAAGVRGIRLEPSDEVIASEVHTEGSDLLVVSENGFGKRTALKNFPLQRRGGKGVTALKRTDKTGDLVGAQMARADQIVTLISSSGQVIRMLADEISLIGRATQGVTLMKPKPNEVVVSMTVDDASSDRVEDVAALDGKLTS